MSSKFAPDFYFFFITLTLFTLGFLAPIDKKTHPDYFLKKQYENKVTSLKKSKKSLYVRSLLALLIFYKSTFYFIFVGYYKTGLC